MCQYLRVVVKKAQVIVLNSITSIYYILLYSSQIYHHKGCENMIKDLLKNISLAILVQVNKSHNCLWVFTVEVS